MQEVEAYKEYFIAHQLLEQILNFVDEKGNTVLQLGAIVKIPEEMLKSIIQRDTLQADEFIKFQAALMWSKANCCGKSLIFRKLIRSFSEIIKFEFIPCDVLIKEIYPLKVVSNVVIIKALAHQADPTFEDFPIIDEHSDIKDSKQVALHY